MADVAGRRAALYFRQSLDVQEGIDRQRNRCQKLAEAKGWEVVGEYEDNDTSASKARKAGTRWADLLDDARAKKFDIVIAVDLDRLLRTINDLITLTETGAKVLTVDGEIDLTTADGEFRATMLAGIARFEARRKGERQLRANAHAAALGRRTGGRRPFGYEEDGTTIRRGEAAAVVDGYRDFLTGVPLAAISRDWNARGFETTQLRRGARRDQPHPWSAQAVRQVLKNPRNMGKRAHNGEIVADAAWPALVEESTYLSTMAILTGPSHQRHTPTRGRYLLSGLAVCGVCRANAQSGGNSTPGHPAYRCSGSYGHFSRSAPAAEEYVEAVMVARLSRSDARELMITKQHDDGPALSLEAVGLRARLDALAVDFADGSLTTNQLRIATERMRERLARVEELLADVGRFDVLGPLVNAPDVKAAWDGLSIDKKRAVIATLATVVLYPPGRGKRVFDPETVGIEWVS
jgi:site-specific DNA recombinase